MATPMPQLPLDNQQAPLYDDVGILNTYDFDPGVCILPVAEDPPDSTDPAVLNAWSPVVVLRLHAPYRIRKVSYQESKQNNPPIVPSPEDVGMFVFLGGSVTVMNNINPSAYNYDWGVSSSYVFVENCVSRIRDGLVLGAPPLTWATTRLNANTTGIANSATLVGAASQAGYDVLVGVSQGGQIDFASPLGWGYNSPAYYPGRFFDSYLVNGGYPPA